jgi:hypothetical protein
VGCKAPVRVDCAWVPASPGRFLSCIGGSKLEPHVRQHGGKDGLVRGMVSKWRGQDAREAPQEAASQAPSCTQGKGLARPCAARGKLPVLPLLRGRLVPVRGVGKRGTRSRASGTERRKRQEVT